ncbi:MAG: hypothetical protein Q9211_003167, partial [Gyalolechia sp. 1 TL-2023]
LELFAGRAVRERYVIVRNVIKEVDFFLLQEKAGTDGMNRGISPALVEETTVLIEAVEKVRVGLRSEPVKVANLEV